MGRRALVSGLLIGMLLLPAYNPRASAAPENPLVGVWRVPGPGAGIYIFTPTHYSMMAATTDRPDIVDTSKSTADEMRALWGPMVANAGAYEIDGNLLTIHPVVAKFPVVMKPGAYEVYAFEIQGNKLTLTQRRNVRGPVERGSVATLDRVE
jgi:Lipocalin-like domain